ncbi:MAG: hypothetical protein WBQ86_23995 [Candidatus Binatus sp.]
MAQILKFRRTKSSSEPSRREMWRRFRDDRPLRQINQISDHEMALLERTALLGEFHSTEDLLFVLKAIRGGASAELQNDDRIQRGD